MKEIFKILTLLLIVNMCYAGDGGHLSFVMLNLDIKHTMQEHDRQKKMRRGQSSNMALEKTNKKEWEKFNNVKKDIKKRLNFISFALQAAPTGYVLTQETAKIKDNQEKLFDLIQTAPYGALPAFDDQIELLDDMEMVVRFIIGLTATYGTINEMERAERQILLDFAIDEIKSLRTKSRMLYLQVRETVNKIRLNKAKLKYIVNRDKGLVEDIFEDINKF